MDLAQVIPQLLEGISQELGVEGKDVKLVIVAYEGDIKAVKQIQHCYEGLAWELKPTIPHHNSEPYVEVQLKTENLLMPPHTCSQGSIACDIKGRQQPLHRRILTSIIVPRRIIQFMSECSPQQDDLCDRR